MVEAGEMVGYPEDYEVYVLCWLWRLWRFEWDRVV